MLLKYYSFKLFLECNSLISNESTKNDKNKKYTNLDFNQIIKNKKQNKFFKRVN